MLKNIDKHYNYSIIHIAGREYRIRYSLNALLCLEILYKPLDEILKTDFRSGGIDDVIQLVHAAMCSVSKNFKAVNRRDFEYVRPTVAELGELINTSDLPLLRREIIDAVLDSIPESQENDDKEKPVKAFNEGHQRALYVDVMGRPEREYWSSTNKEIADRIDYYMEVRGMKETPELVQEFDDD